MRKREATLFKRILLAAGALFAGLWASSSALAQEQVLTLEDAIQLALKANEDALIADQKLEAADARLTKARAYFLPTINLNAGYTRRPFEVVRIVGNAQIIVQNYNALSGSANLSLTLFDSRSIPALQQAKSDLQAERLTKTESYRQLAFEVGNAYLATLGTDQLLEASRRRLEFAKQSLEAAKARYTAGLVSVNDVTRAELEFASAGPWLIKPT
jgi:outer membrane protein TolC